MLNSILLKKAVISLMLARIFYTVNWFNIPSIFFFIAVDFDKDISVLGLITASFFIGVGLFQVLAGILASKYSPRKIAILGIAIASTAVFFSAFSIDLFSIAVLRFIVGVGMAFFFGPSVILISEYVGRQSEGLGMGLLNSAHAIGGIIGLFIWVLVAEIFGWRTNRVGPVKYRWKSKDGHYEDSRITEYVFMCRIRFKLSISTNELLFGID